MEGDYRTLCRPACSGQLHAHCSTVACAAAGCVVCAHRLVVLPRVDGRPDMAYRPNARPEACLRLARGEGKPSAGIYAGVRALLTVGDGDLGFSLALARSLESSCRITATTHLSRVELDEVYGRSRMESTVGALSKRTCSLVHGVDARALSQARLPGAPFDRVVWNFPCVPGQGGADGQNEEMEANCQLLQGFFRAAAGVVRRGGEVHVAHKTKPPFSHWRIWEQAELSGAAFTYRGQIVFDPTLHLGYRPRKSMVGSGGSFPTVDAVVYVWTKVDGEAPAACAPTLDLDQGESSTGPRVRLGLWQVAPSGPSCLRLSEELLDAICTDVLAVDGGSDGTFSGVPSSLDEA